MMRASFAMPSIQQMILNCSCEIGLVGSNEDRVARGAMSNIDLPIFEKF